MVQKTTLGDGVANVDGFRGGPVDVGALPAGDSAWGCRGMLGNAWAGCRPPSPVHSWTACT